MLCLICSITILGVEQKYLTLNIFIVTIVTFGFEDAVVTTSNKEKAPPSVKTDGQTVVYMRR